MTYRILGLALVVSLAACTPGEQRPAPAGPPSGPAAPAPTPETPGRTSPLVRVGIVVDSANVRVGSPAPHEVLFAGRVLARGAAGQEWEFTADAGGISGRSGGERIGPVAGPVVVRAAGEGGVQISGRAYRGDAIIRSAGTGRLTAVNTVLIEDYLLGVVPLEIGARPPGEIEAVKAQAIAARTYAIGNMGSRERLGFDVYPTVADQVYGGRSREDSVATRAVRETAGEVLTHNGRPIIAYYHSTCGGQTADLSEAWPWRAQLPYLRSTSDRIPGTDRHYCDVSNRFNWSVAWTGEELAAVLARTIPYYAARAGSTPRVEDVELVSRTAHGRVDELRIRTDGQTLTVRGDSVRWILRPDGTRLLNSALLSAVTDSTVDGRLVRLEVRGGGWGHGVGMCQFGAMGRARAGQSYREILGAYYNGAKLERLY